MLYQLSYEAIHWERGQFINSQSARFALSAYTHGQIVDAELTNQSARFGLVVLIGNRRSSRHDIDARLIIAANMLLYTERQNRTQWIRISYCRMPLISKNGSILALSFTYQDYLVTFNLMTSQVKQRAP